jgi:hypothetical protein
VRGKVSDVMRARTEYNAITRQSGVMQLRPTPRTHAGSTPTKPSGTHTQMRLYPYPQAWVWVSVGMGAGQHEMTHGLPLTNTRRGRRALASHIRSIVLLCGIFLFPLQW